ncbi:SusC/RagA family TonB-linked outer membrane protein [Parachryseolinea silvisoli]|uniref:SusC/RagA family TonB-linked outer membrane protein n=1 Tax=Parachryseolinea silvisoli TaxID=2873601 RepID=UPI0022657FD1|nr:SusC/RagA family TonB-linked outer membrane protein [Parachryseolinea silvisoli]MCD9015599.1 SusC/RagA family TonB-linked outer membrane protein [Parachryseolinea silvisoli]
MEKFVRRICIVFFLLVTTSAWAQDKTVEGTVIGTDGTPLPGANVIVKGTTRGVQTDADGKFVLQVTPSDVLLFSYIGYKNVEVPVGNQSTITTTLQDDEGKLEEVVVTALGISKEKKSLGYTVQEVKSNQLSEARENNLVNALSGKVAGVRVTNSQGNLGSSRIVIRGETSIAGNNQPLFVVDGLPVDNSQLTKSDASRDFPNAISDINTEDIESISVLKGPNAAALYGSRAANGVIIINTKKGRGGKRGLGIAVTSGVTFERLLVLPDYQNVYGQGAGGEFSYVDGKGGGVNDGVDESWGPKMDGRLIPQFYSNGEAVPFLPHPDNVKDFFVTGHTINNGVAISGAKEGFDYRFSYNNSKQKGVVPNTDQTKNSFSVNASYTLHPKLVLSTSANFIRTESDNLPGTFGRRATSTMLQFTWFGRQVDINRLKDYKDADGNTFNWNNSYYSNPYWVAYENTVGQRRDRFFGNVNLNYKIVEGLTANFRTGNDLYNDRRKIRIAYGTNGTPFGSYQEIGYAVNENNTQFTLNYKKDLTPDFNLDVLGGANYQYRFQEENNQFAPRLAVKDVYTLNNSRDPLQSTNFYSRQKIYSLFASGQVGFRNYAFLNLTARNDWSSTLPSNNNSYFYPSVNASVVLSEALGFASNTVSFVKVRAGWSKVGKDADPYQLLNTYPFSVPFGSSPRLTVSDKYLNADLKPETTTSTEAGVEASFLDDRITVDASYYFTRSKNQILNVDVSPSTGYTSKLINAGEIENRGVELQLTGVPVITSGGFRWEVNVNWAKNVSKVVELDKEGFLQSYRLGSDGVEVRAGVGEPYGVLFGPGFLRNDKGQIVVSADGTPAIDPSNKVLGRFTPNWIGGINNAVSYKGISLSFLVDVRMGGQIYSGTRSTGLQTGVLAETLNGRDAEHGGLPYYFAGDDTGTTPVALPDHSASAPNGETVYHDGILFNGVTADGSPNTTIAPAPLYYKTLAVNGEYNTFDATFVKLREVKLGYTIPSSLTRRVGLQSATVSLVGRNLWIIHKDAPHIDPETALSTSNAQGLEDLQLPTTRSYGFNITLNF